VSGRNSAVGELRHTFRTPVNHIVGYTEMLLEDLPPGDEEHRAPLQVILAAAHDALQHISAVLVPSSTPPTDAVRRLYDELEEPQAQIIRAVTSLISAHDLGDAAADDLRRILHAAEQLRPKDLVVAAAPVTEEEPAEERAARILVVDDVEDNRQLLKRRLEKQGYTVSCAEDGKKALAMVESELPDLVLLDIMMPELDGFAVLERMKGKKETRDIPVIVISALDDTASAVRCIEQGAEDFLPKPFDPVLLKARVGASLARKRARDQERAVALAAEAVATAAAAVEAGTYKAGMLAGVARRRDAVGRLARVFDGMATNVRAREQQLHERVRALKTDITKARESNAGGPGGLAPVMLQTGERIANRYEVLATLGRGGMGAVFRVKDSELGEEIALKTLRKESMADEAVIERFKSEIRLARKITHRNVVRTHDLGEYEGGYFLTMELVEGITVRELIDTRGTLSMESVLAIGTQLCDALAAAHAEGVIHRDVKPHNLLVDAEGVLKVMDFGVARLTDRAGAGLTEIGLVVGTPAYMPPEQLLGEEVDVRADLYAVGVVLFEAATGRLPFEAATAMTLIAKLLKDEPARARTLNDAVPIELDELIAQLLAKRPDSRPATAAAVRDRLSQMG
jgi:DNA-binding response OmpR family regulator